MHVLYSPKYLLSPKLWAKNSQNFSSKSTLAMTVMVTVNVVAFKHEQQETLKVIICL